MDGLNFTERSRVRVYRDGRELYTLPWFQLAFPDPARQQPEDLIEVETQLALRGTAVMDDVVLEVCCE